MMEKYVYKVFSLQWQDQNNHNKRSAKGREFHRCKKGAFLEFLAQIIG
jgi:hypothetical protein